MNILTVKEKAMKKVILAISLLVAGSAVAAPPAPFYRWASKLNGFITCAQTSPGSGWVLASPTPYRDAGCRVPY
ncbi:MULTISPECIES: hypothetical protein [unclassified Sphingomonas]|nr:MULTISPECIES: hypothetical protein [unclassified Sphingomonas]